MKKILLLMLCWSVTEQTTVNSPRGPWQLAFRAVHNKKSGSHQDFYSLYASSDVLNANVPSIIRDFTRSGEPYKSGILEDWTAKKINIQAVKLSFFKNGAEKQFIVFNGVGQDKTTWMDCKNILYSSFTDIKGSTPAICDMGASLASQRFSIMRTSLLNAPCDQQKGWIYAGDRSASFFLCSSSWPSSFAEKPFFLYSSGTTSATFTTGIEMADSMAIFVQAWDMVFKGVTGQEGFLYHIWSSTSEVRNDKDLGARSLATSNLQTYKSPVANNWTSYDIDQVKYAMFDSGSKEAAYVVFNGRNSDHLNWFENSRILYSSYTDIKQTKSVCSIQGDGIRRWQIHKTSSSTCGNNEAWMEVLDDTNGTAPCAFDQIAKRPYFLHSSLTTAATLQSGNSLNAAHVTDAKRMAVFVHGWHMVFKISAGSSMTPSTSAYDLWTQNVTLNTGSEAAMSVFPGSPSYKSDIINSWYDNIIRSVKLGFYSGGQEKAYAVFDASTAGPLEWLDCKRLLYWSYSDSPSSPAVCSMSGESSKGLRFLMAESTGSCNDYQGWFVLQDTNSSKSCSWEKANPPRMLYSTGSGKAAFTDFAEADTMVISLDMDECLSNPCTNNATCEDTAGSYICHCHGAYYGKECADLDGGWTVWANWTSCTVSCGGGVQARTRQCSNPPSEGAGSCHGDSLEKRACNVQFCPIDGKWSNWTEWTNCTAECNGGYRNRTRECNNPAPQHGGLNCSGNATAEEVCNAQPCPIDGGWSNWTTWGVCSKTCNGGIQMRTKSCDNPAAQYGGDNCTGISEESRECNNQTCPPVDGNWGSWQAWGECSASCAGGVYYRNRSCDNPMPEFGGNNCTGNSTGSGPCNEQPCPIHGGWGNWSEFSNCTFEDGYQCGDGKLIQYRNCSNPPPQYGGNPCSGNKTNSEPCYVNCTLICPGQEKSFCKMPDSSCGRPKTSVAVLALLISLLVIGRLN